jgi:cystathionine beta-lyase family protein involved in aluminum resistance
MTQFGGMHCGASLKLNTRMYNGIPFKAPLILETSSTEAEFLAAIRLSGLID